MRELKLQITNIRTFALLTTKVFLFNVKSKINVAMVFFRMSGNFKRTNMFSGMHDPYMGAWGHPGMGQTLTPYLVFSAVYVMHAPWSCQPSSNFCFLFQRNSLTGCMQLLKIC